MPVCEDSDGPPVTSRARKTNHKIRLAGNACRGGHRGEVPKGHPNLTGLARDLAY